MLLSMGTMAQTTTIIGTGATAGSTGSNGSPIYRSSATSGFDYSQSVLLYTFADLSAAGIYNGAVISSVGFNKTNAFGIAPGAAGSMTIAMNNSGSNSLDTSDTYANLTTGFTTVYTNAAVDETIIPSAAGYVVFTLDTPFTYTGGSIEIGLDWDISAAAGSPTTGGFAFAYDTVTGVQGRGNSNSSPITAALTTGNTRLYQAEMVYTGGTAPTCLPPTALAAVSNTFDTADLSWTSGGSGETAWDIELGPEGFTPTGTPTNAGVANPYTAMSLTANTGYDYYVRADCGGGDFSTWAGPFNFRTLCTAVADFNENFDGVSTPDLPSCWTSFSTTPVGTTAAVVQTSTAGDSSVPNGIRMYSGSLTGNIGSGTTDEGENILISPALSNLAAGTHRIRFSADAGTATSTIEVGTMADATDPSTFTALGTFAPTTTHAEYIQDFDTYTGTDQFVAFRHVFAGTFDTMYLDDIVWEAIPSCIAATDLALVSATDTMATIGWTNNAGAAASSVIYGPAGFDPLTAGTTVAGGADSATISGLTGETNYDFYVTQDCTATGDGLSAQAGPLSIQTPCAPIAAPYFVDFESFTAATSGFVNDQCWNEVSPTDFDWAIDAAGGTSSTGTGPSGAYSGTTFMFVEASNGANGDVATVLSRAVDLSALTTPSVSFYYHMYGAFITDLTVAVSTDNGATFTTELTITGQQQTANADPWEQAVIDLSSYAGQTIIVAFTTSKSTMTGNTYEADISIDDVNFDELPTCIDVTGITEDSILSNSVTVSWTENNTPPSAAWEVLAVPAGDPAPAVGATNATAIPFIVPGLAAETSYDIYVRTDCATAFPPPLTVTTPCAAIVPDSFEPFDTFLPNCWEEASTGDLTTGPMTLGSGDWGVEEFAHASTSGGGAVNVNLFNLGTSDWVISPIYDLSAGGYELNMDIAVTGFNNTSASAMGSDDSVQLVYSTDGTTWTVLETWDASNTPSEVGTTYNNPLTGLNSATTQFALYATEGTVDDAEDYDFHMDNFQVRTPPTCPDTANLTLVNNTDVEATINFDSGNATSAGNYEYSLTTVAGTAPAVTGAWTDVPGATPNVTYTITGLTAETEYFVHVREVCVVGDESAWSLIPLNFTTACAAIAAPYLEDFEMFTPSSAAFSSENCWSGSGGSYFWESAAGTDTSSSGTGPSPTITTGNYFFTEASLGSAGDTTDLVSPLVDLTALAAPALTFDYHMFGAQIGTLDVLVNGTTNVFSISGQQQVSDTDPWGEAIVDLAAYAGQTISITFRATGAGTFEGDIAIDNVSFTELPVCNDVSAITLDSVTSDSVTVSWTENSLPPATSWEVVAVPAGDPAPAVGTSNATMNPFTLTGLTSSTVYDIYIRPDCATVFAAPIPGTTLAGCGDTVYDTGGAGGAYSNNESYTITYMPDVMGNVVTLDFISVALETCCDTLEVFDGVDTAATAFSTDLEAPALFRATNTDGAITIRFTSDGSVTDAGWEANYTCAAPPSCLEPSALMAGNITTTTADLSWTTGGSGETAWDVEIVTAGTAATGTPTDLGVANPFMATGLTSGTDYEYYVRAACGPGDVSIWSGPFAFTTTAACGDMIYDTGGATGQYSINESYTVTYLPDTIANVVTLDFTLVDLENCCDTLTIYDGLDTSAPVLEADLENPASFTALNTDGAITIEFTSDGSVVGDGWVASYTCTARPSCVDVSGIMIDSFTSDSVTVSWIENNIPPATAWEVVAVTAGSTAPMAGTTNATATPFMIGSLTPNTGYDVYVRTDCSMNFVGPVSFTTACAPATMFPVTTDFTNNVPNACWSEAGSGEITDGPMNIGASDWRANRSYTNSSGTVVPSNVINLWQNVDREWLISESYDLSSLTTKVLTVEVAVTNYSFSGNTTATDVMGSDDSVDLLVTDDGGMTWTSLQTWNVANQPAVDGERVFIDLAAYSGTVQFAFLGSDGTVDDTEDYDFHVGVFVVDATAGNEDTTLQNAVTIYPNPVNGDTMTINLGATPASQVGITIYNTLGQEVINRTYNSVSNNTIVVENLSSLNSGVYLVNISNGDATAVKRFIKQ